MPRLVLEAHGNWADQLLTPQQEPAHVTTRLFTAGDPRIDAAVGDRALPVD